MLDLDRLRRVKLNRRPPGQIFFGWVALWPDYHFPRRSEIVLEGAENVRPGGGTILAMNHTDRYNYWPLQYQMWRQGLPFTATWVKGKYYENAWMARFMDSMNNIPLPSRGYVIATEFRKSVGHPPGPSDYRALRELVDGARGPEDLFREDASEELRAFVGEGEGQAKVFLERFEVLFEEMIREVVRLTRLAVHDLGSNVLVFPQGTRSKRLSRGLTGMMQMAQHLGTPIVPVGCNGSDRLYPGNSPFSRGGRVVYRIGKPLALDGPELAPHRVPADVVPLSEGARNYDASYQTGTEVVMNRINELLDPEYQYSEDRQSEGSEGINRFL